MGNRRYDPDFKREAVRLAVEEGMGVREVERNLGISFGVVKGWVQRSSVIIRMRRLSGELLQIRRKEAELKRWPDRSMNEDGIIASGG